MNLRRRMMIRGNTGGGDEPYTPLPGEVFGTNVQALDVVFADANNDLHIIHGEENWDSSYTPIGIVLIPGSHNRYGNTSLHGVMGLTEVSSKTTGDLKPSSDCFAVDSYATRNTPLTDYVYSYNTYDEAKLPYEKQDGTVAFDTSKNTDINNVYFPYNSDGTVATAPSGCLVDFNGEGNTAVYAGISRNNYPYIDVALKYTTAGTEAGDWYLPAAGEIAYYSYYSVLVYDVVRKALNTTYGTAVGSFSEDLGHWTSTENDGSHVWQLLNGIITTAVSSKSGADGRGIYFTKLLK